MAGCCGGKNAGKPISWPRYLVGLAFFTTYHGAVQAALTGASLVTRQMAPVRDFHASYFGHLLREAVGRDGISVGGQTPDDACEIDAA